MAIGGCSISAEGGATSSLLPSIDPLLAKPTDGKGTQRCESKTIYKYQRNCFSPFMRNFFQSVNYLGIILFGKLSEIGHTYLTHL